MPGASLTRALRRLRAGRRRRLARGLAATDEASPFELVTRRGLDDLVRDVERLEAKLNGILIALSGTLLIDLYRALTR